MPVSTAEKRGMGDGARRTRGPARSPVAVQRPGLAGRLHRGWSRGWIGWLLAVLIVPVALSGAILAVWPAVERVAHPTRFAGGGVIDADACVTAVRAQLTPGRRIVAMERGASVLRFVVQEAGRTDGIFACTARGNGVAAADARHDAEAWVRRVHATLAMPWAGRGLVAMAGAALIVLALSGVVLWGGAVLRGGDAGPWHRWLGLAAMLPILAMTVSGLPLLWAATATLRDTIPLAQPAQPVHIVEAHALALTGGTVARVEWPTRRSPDWTVTVAAGSARQVKVADDTGGALAALSRTEGGRLGGSVAASLHGAGGTGWWRRILRALTGLAVVVLVATGLATRRSAKR